MASLKIELKESKLTRNVEMLGKMDPYCILRTPFQEWTSTTHKRAGKFPRWSGQYFFATEKGLASELEISIIDEELFSSKLIGKTKVSMTTFMEGEGVDKWVEVFFNGQSAGKIRFESTFKPSLLSKDSIRSLSQIEDVPQETRNSVIAAIKTLPLKGIILVGGFAVDMRPLTLEKPTSALSFVNKPILVHQIEALIKVGCTKIVLAMTTKPENFQKFLEEYMTQLGNPNIDFSIETKAMGTAGALANCKDKLDEGEGFQTFVLNGNVMCLFPLELMLDQHRTNGKQVTMMVRECKEGLDLAKQDRSQFGQVQINQNGLVTKYSEKVQEIESQFINCGIYLIKSSAIDLIEPGKQSLELDLFPQLVGDNQLTTYKLTTWWQRIGNTTDFLNAQRKYVRRLAEHGEDLLNNSVIHPSAQVEAGAEIGPNAVIGPGCKIATGTRIVNSCIMENTIVNKGSLISDSIVAFNNVLAPFCRLENTTTAKGCEFEEQALLIDCKVGPYRTIGGKAFKEIFL